MANINISQLPNLSPLTAAAVLPVDSGGSTYHVTAANLATYINTNAGNIIPALDNTYFLGNSTNRWANIYLGPGTLYITDSNIASNATAELTVLNGVLQINGVNQIEAKGITNGNANIAISNTGNVTITTLPGSTPLQWIFDDTGNLRCASVTEQDNLIGENNGDFFITGSQSIKLNAGLSGNVSLTVNESNITVTGDIFTTGNLTVSTNPTLPDAIDVNGTIYDASVIVSDIGNAHVAQILLTRFSTSTQPIIAGAMNNSDDPTANVDVAYGQALFQIGSVGYAGTNYKEFGGIVFSAEDNNLLYTISDTSAPGKIDFNTTPNGEVSTSTGMTLHCDQTLRFSNGLILNSGNVPVTSKGQTGDLAGMFIIDNSYIYYCTADYTDGTADIWNRTEQTTGTW
jgi:hypothetical protein